MKGHLIFRNVGLPGYNRKSYSLIESPDLQTKYVQSLWAFSSAANTFLFFHNCDVLNSYYCLRKWTEPRNRQASRFCS